ncbi:MAG: hypothetical protein JSW16_04670 [Dehalococcoidales bacterium]|nr:MAG: hypothetical protein JSW16_04670 [Dehalococcoidales bacterium]
MPSSKRTVSALIYEDSPRYDLWLKVILGSIIALTLILGFVLLTVDILGAWIMFGTTLFDALLFRAILPRWFQIFDDRVKILLGGPFALNIPLVDISEVRQVSGREAFIYWGIRFATSLSGVIEIVRRKGLSVVISPHNPDMFLGQANRALEAAHDRSQPSS